MTVARSSLEKERPSQTAATEEKRNLYSKNLPPNPFGGRFYLKAKSLNYGVGDAVVVVVSVVVDEDVSGLAVAIGVDSAGLVVVVDVLELSEVLPVLGDGLTMVVLFSGAGEAAGAVVSVRCSHAAKSAALASMQIYFFIGVKD